MESNRYEIHHHNEDMRKRRREEGEMMRERMEEDRRQEKVKDTIQYNNMKMIQHDNRYNNDVRRYQREMDMERAKLLDMRNIEYNKIEMEKMHDADRMRKEWVDEVAYSNYMMSDELKRKKLRDTLEDRRKWVNDIQTTDPYTINQHLHLLKVRGGNHHSDMNAYRQGKMEYLENERRSQLDLAEEYRKSMKEYVEKD